MNPAQYQIHRARMEDFARKNPGYADLVHDMIANMDEIQKELLAWEAEIKNNPDKPMPSFPGFSKEKMALCKIGGVLEELGITGEELDANHRPTPLNRIWHFWKEGVE